MALLDTFRPVAALTDLLDKEKDAILKTDFSALQALAKPKENLMALVAKSQVPVATLSSLQNRIERNQRLLTASAKGIHMARERLASLKAPLPEFNTYGPAGTTTSMVRKSLTMKRKA
ncbi:MAG: hypothetical protein HWE33_05565 [Rhodobacteraceae bacterium]|uniref:flagellar protein FlgN n=1 Tax=Celeribacter sp. HF31 TaxID=2721558 RepID=UPI0014318958|nr:flagellar protein FlgN [Celeribacter sp. HF31]NIY79304.1 flagellar protein FlgN [Celeribacter sp. HF31]NVK45756.1 hypothetical protein [Paracoccaceae bacterium]